MKHHEGGIRGTIGYDAQCPVCLSTMARWRTVFSLRGFAWVPLQDRFWADRLGLAPGETPEELVLELQDGRRLSGAAAVLWLARQVAWLRPLGVVASLPGLRRLATAAYGWIARNRYCLGDVCTLPAQWGRARRHPVTIAFLEFP